MQVTDQKLEIAIGRMLQTGVLLAAAVVLAQRSLDGLALGPVDHVGERSRPRAATFDS